MLPTLNETAFARLLSTCRATGVPFLVDATPYDAYLKRKQAFDAFFANLPAGEAGYKCVDYLLIAEAPPPLDSETYFYSPEDLSDTAWFRVPKQYFLGMDIPVNQAQKQQMLDDLAGQGVLLVDLCPFPLSGVDRSHRNFPQLVRILYKQYFCPCILDPLHAGGHLHNTTKFALMATLKTNVLLRAHLAGYGGGISAAVGVPAPITRPTSYTAPRGVVFGNTITAGVLAGLGFLCYGCARNGPHGYLLSGALE